MSSKIDLTEGTMFHPDRVDAIFESAIVEHLEGPKQIIPWMTDLELQSYVGSEKYYEDLRNDEIAISIPKDRLERKKHSMTQLDTEFSNWTISLTNGGDTVTYFNGQGIEYLGNDEEDTISTSSESSRSPSFNRRGTSISFTYTTNIGTLISNSNSYSTYTSSSNSPKVIIKPTSEVDIWGCITDDPNLEEYIEPLKKYAEKVCPLCGKNIRVPWISVHPECKAKYSLSERKRKIKETIESECTWLFNFDENTGSTWKTDHMEESLEFYFHYLGKPGVDDDKLFDTYIDNDLEGMSMGEEESYHYLSANADFQGYFYGTDYDMWDDEEEEELELEDISYPENGSYTKRMNWIIPWITDMLRDTWLHTITEERVTEYFSAYWFDITNPELQDKWFHYGEHEGDNRISPSTDRINELIDWNIGTNSIRISSSSNNVIYTNQPSNSSSVRSIQFNVELDDPFIFIA